MWVDAGFTTMNESLRLEPVAVSLKATMESEQRPVKSPQKYCMRVFSFRGQEIPGFYEPLDIDAASQHPSEHRLVTSTLPLCHFHLFSL